MMAVLGKIAVVKAVKFVASEEETRQLCVISVQDGPDQALPGAALTVVDEEDSDKESVDAGSEEEEEEEEDRVRVPLRLNMRVEDQKRKKKRKVC